MKAQTTNPIIWTVQKQREHLKAWGVLFVYREKGMYENLSLRKIKNCILAKRQMLDESAIDDCKLADCSSCGWNKYENRRRQINLMKQSNSKHWVKRKDII